MADVQRKIYGLQFHPEVTHTEHGLDIIRRFVLDICGSAPVWTAKNVRSASTRITFAPRCFANTPIT